MNVADRRIVELVQPGDLVITADIPLVAEVVAKGGQVISATTGNAEMCSYNGSHAGRQFRTASTTWR
jgi:uncharacterized protein YaiI (UPF0178 family)